MHRLTTSLDFDTLLDAPVALVYKHSTRCPIAGVALDEVELLAELRPELPIHVVDVIRDRALSREVAERLGVTHHSPQAILLVHGRPVWAASHFEVRAETIVRRLDAATTPSPERKAG
ncbi:MAG: bacillithiol system redox-active protein YtxJ [Gemmatirosa sp.]